MKTKTGPRVLLLDIETSPLLSYTWGIWQQDIALNQIKKDWHVLSWSAKWLDDPPSKVMYRDQRNAVDIEDDKAILVELLKLLNQADVLVTQNGKEFDMKKLNARFVLHGMPPPAPVKHIDTYKLAKKHFAFTSNKLEYLSDKLATKYKKQKHKKFAGFELWKACLAGNVKAWESMCRYNKYDVLALEEVYRKLVKWDSAVNFSLYTADNTHLCKCGATDDALMKRGYHYTGEGKFQRYQCCECGAWSRDKRNLLSRRQRKQLVIGAR